ncbi:thymidylate kinase [Companilactobacillus sp. RD055328]|uniref:dTMP kinase n=1 Tax=Companilactobacillus sp. RD055328 TaxID=2916634 RepID=UPI001FC8B62F|nr:dTMP kinase [Companilactobacillus sp. RD055328]GKQ42156.1 thymidylate kinase [Companilactobacillus sp. RD055328]
MTNGIFISFEGPDGAGKTTALNTLLPMLEAKTTKEIITTREPGGSPIAEKIRDLILDVKNLEMDDRTEALLYAAQRRQHLVDRILPALEADKIVLSDRFVDSSIAYQGGGRQIGEAEVKSINDFAIEDTMPELTVYFDIPSEVGLQRIKKDRDGQQDRLEKEKLEFHQRVRHTYLDLQAQDPKRIKVINANQDPTQVVEDVLELILTKFPQAFSK